MKYSFRIAVTFITLGFLAIPVYLICDYLNLIPDEYSMVRNLVVLAAGKIEMFRNGLPVPKGIPYTPIEQTAVFYNVAAGLGSLFMVLVAVPAFLLLAYIATSAFSAVKETRRNYVLGQFTKAAELLESSNAALREAGIVILSEIAKSNTKDHHGDVLQLLAAHIRSTSSEQRRNLMAGKEHARSRGELMTSLHKVSELKQRFGKKTSYIQLDLSGGYFRGLTHTLLSTSKTQKTNPDLSYCILSDSVFDDADLTNANFNNADVSRARVEDKWKDLFSVEQWASVQVINDKGKVIRPPII
ncbi:Pentapeptide repeats (8 copies) [Pseudovibrio axinellae]|uniref:Pentapeptide repeats (8 copies) n=1 Tax=Pseudovibrio axinellae TaxID=989403 RepID=A0A165SYA0_9HYPH|nr:pentapeptide repeat-containing protein [Pseudovibrio axinellae]KZL05017.1 Pentapeptide repeats (8 copies) [Pseudovibrio axinellae]SER64922.1 Pentapeptide repeat-containing protein [Pseudovibrio axinellae]